MILCQYNNCNKEADYDIDYDCGETIQNIKICKPHYDGDDTFSKFVIKKERINLFVSSEKLIKKSLLEDDYI